MLSVEHALFPVVFFFVFFFCYYYYLSPNLNKSSFRMFAHLRLLDYFVCFLFLLVSGKAVACDCSTPRTCLLPFFHDKSSRKLILRFLTCYPWISSQTRYQLVIIIIIIIITTIICSRISIRTTKVPGYQALQTWSTYYHVERQM